MLAPPLIELAILLTSKSRKDEEKMKDIKGISFIARYEQPLLAKNQY
jgi:hypothetical protein